MKQIVLIILSSIAITVGVGAQSFRELTKMMASEPDTMDKFGSNVSISGDYAIVGAYLDDDDAFGKNSIFNAGAAYIFERDVKGNWKESQKLVASDRSRNDWFGKFASISGDYAIVGAYQKDFGTGSAYIFERNLNGHWRETQKLNASDKRALDWFGSCVHIYQDYALVGASREDEDSSGTNTLNGAGSLYVFKRDLVGTWIEVQKLVSSDRSEEDRFGCSVSRSGEYLIVGALFEDDDSFGVNTLSKAGSAYIFKRDMNGIWTETEKIVASDRNIDDLFGAQVSMSDGYAIVGAYGDDGDESGRDYLTNAGAAYIFERDSSGHWTESQKLVASTRERLDGFGGSVSLSGIYSIISASNRDDARGIAYIFKRENSGNWIEYETLEASDGKTYDGFGSSVSISGDCIIVGAPRKDAEPSTIRHVEAAGFVYFFELLPKVPSANDGFVRLWPNPFRETFSMLFDTTYSEVTISTYNTLGQELALRSYFNTNNINFDLDGVPGIYLVQISTSTGRVINYKVVKQ